MAVFPAYVAVLAAAGAPMVVVWLALTLFRRAGRHQRAGDRHPGAAHRVADRRADPAERAYRADIVAGFGCGLAAAGAAFLLLAGADRLLGLDERGRLTILIPVVEEGLKAAAILLAVGAVGAVGAAAALRARRLAFRRCATATLTVVAAFAAGENLGHLAPLLVADGGRATSGLVELLRVRTVLPPLGHAAETWPVAAAIWLASRCRPGRRRVGVLAGAVVVAVASHALWNASALRWWPDPTPLVAILAVSGAVAVIFAVGALRRERRERWAATGHVPAAGPPVALAGPSRRLG